MMSLAVVALTKKGSSLGAKLAKELDGKLYIKDEHRELNFGKVYTVEGNFTQFVERLFKENKSIIFIMACGIVVRAIAPYLENKRKDPAVVVMDEMGKHAISLLSGHVGGGNALARNAALITGGDAVITTATDINGVFAFDMFAQKSGCVLENPQNLKLVSAGLLHGKKINFYSYYPISGDIPDNIVYRYLERSEEWDKKLVGSLNVVLSNTQKSYIELGDTLYIRPKNLILGIGCRKGVAKEAIKEAILDFLNKLDKSINSIKHVASVEIKKDEKGIIEFCREYEIPFVTVTVESIKEQEGKFSYSAFVKDSVGVGGVCEASCILSSNNGNLIKQKTVYKGITLSLAEEECEFLI